MEWVELENVVKAKKYVFGKTLRKKGFTKLGISVNGTVIMISYIADNEKIPVKSFYLVS